MGDFDWEIVTPGRVYRRLRDRLILDKVLERLKEQCTELWGFNVFWDGLLLFSWDPLGHRVFFNRSGMMEVEAGEGYGKPFCWKICTAGPGAPVEEVLEFGVEPWLFARYVPATGKLDVTRKTA